MEEEHIENMPGVTEHRGGRQDLQRHRQCKADRERVREDQMGGPHQSCRAMRRL